MKRLVLAFVLTLVAGLAHGQVVQMFSGSTGLTIDGAYGSNGNPNDWVDCNAFTCDGRVVAVGGTGAVDVVWECKAQLLDSDEQAYPCYDLTTMTNPDRGLYSTLATAGFYRLKLVNRASGTFKAWIVRVKR